LCFICSDCETYISIDDLRINLWNLEVTDQGFNIVDIKLINMEDFIGTLLNLRREFSTFGDGWTELMRLLELSKLTTRYDFVCVLMEQTKVITFVEFHPTIARCWHIVIATVPFASLTCASQYSMANVLSCMVPPPTPIMHSPLVPFSTSLNPISYWCVDLCSICNDKAKFVHNLMMPL
jgi:hypothetical protein